MAFKFGQFFLESTWPPSWEFHFASEAALEIVTLPSTIGVWLWVCRTNSGDIEA